MKWVENAKHNIFFELSSFPSLFSRSHFFFYRDICFFVAVNCGDGDSCGKRKEWVIFMVKHVGFERSALAMKRKGFFKFTLHVPSSSSRFTLQVRCFDVLHTKARAEAKVRANEHQRIHVEYDERIFHKIYLTRTNFYTFLLFVDR